LALTQIVPYPPDAGPKIKTYHLLRTLTQEHDVELITFTRSEAEEDAARDLARLIGPVKTVPLRRRRVLEPYYAAKGWVQGIPFLVSRDERRTFATALDRRLERGDIDVVHADQLSMALHLPRARRYGARTVFDAHNAVWELVHDLAPRQPTPLHRAAAEVEWRQLRRFEGEACRESDLTLVVSAHDEASLSMAAGGPIRGLVVPIGVEVQERRPVSPSPDSHRLLSVATMHYPPNAEAIRWFRDEIWPIIRTGDPPAVVDIVGTRPPDDLVQWPRQEPRVQVHGYVADVDDLYRQAALFIVPLRAGSGVRVKILEAMAAGVPVVSTSIGIDGLDLQHGEHLLVADDPAAFASATLELLACTARRQALAAAARERVLERYDWRVCCRPVLDAYRELDRARPG
jgi:glycosyltransferase involved in cell wall biosynthesis